MIIKKFQGKSEEDAVAKAKAELGEGIVIMNVKNGVKPKGLFGFLKAKLVEVTVAKEEEAELNAKTDADIKATIASVDKLRSMSDEGQKKESDTSSDKQLGTNIDKKLDDIQSLLTEKIIKAEETASVNKVKDETVKEDSEKQNDNEEADASSENKEMMDLLKLLYNAMIDNEVSEVYANQMIEEIEKNFDKNTNMEYILSHIYQKMILKFGKTETISPSSAKTPKIIYFVGPTGVGKTTTLAKIASMLSLTEHKKVALFTADTYRIAATNQLQTYADILKIPFHVIYEISDMLENFEKYTDYDYILVDTAGHSQHNENQLNTMNDFVHCFDDKAEKEVYLVLSITTKYKDLVSIADKYKAMTDYKLIFTKLDETTTYGNMFNLHMHTGASLSYVTCGQNVPDDIDKFNPQSTVKKLLGGAEG